MDDPASKSCCRCGVTKPLSKFHKRAKAADGLNAACKDCICAGRRQYTKDHPEKLAAYRKVYLEEHREEQRERCRAWHAANKDRASDYHRAWVDANRASRAAARKAWYEANREWVTSWRARNPERAKETAAHYRRENRERRAENQRRRRVAKLGGVVEDVDLEALWTGECGLCRLPMDRNLRWPDPHSPSVDHILPLSLGGAHEPINLQWAHLTCNVRKGARVAA